MGSLSDISRRLRQWIDRREAAPPAGTVAARDPDPALPLPGDWPVRHLEPVAGGSLAAGRYPVGLRLEIGRAEQDRTPEAGQLLLDNPSVSWRHCVVTLTPEGRCTVRDLSRNGTRVNGRRLVPNVETELGLGQTLEIAPGLQFVLTGEPAGDRATPDGDGASSHRSGTNLVPQLSLATVLVGDIRDYTVMVRKARGTDLQQSVNRLFQRLTAEVETHNGTVKEFPGDAILAFWEGGMEGGQADGACRAALALDQLARRLAEDRAVWSLDGFPLRMDWALASGSVVLDSFGGDTPMGLSLVGEPVVLASRLEKLADDRTGPILVCRHTRDLALRYQRRAEGPRLDFTALEPVLAKGFDRAEPVYALRAPGS